MPDSKSTDSDEHFSTHRSRPDSRRFFSIEDMEADCRADGWSIKYRQVQAGQLTASTALGKCADIKLQDKSASRRIEAVGKTPEGYLTVFAPTGQADTWINGQAITGAGIFLFDACAEFQIISDENNRILLMLVPSSQLQEVGRDIFDNDEVGARIPNRLMEPGVALAQRLRSLMHTVIHQPIGGCWQVEKACHLTTTLGAIVARHAGTSEKTYLTSPTVSLRTVNCACEYIAAHLDRPISVRKICAHNGISVSKLERSFRRELDMSPTEYILSRRLAAANRDLKGARSSGKNIARIAMDCGFNHLGRFSGAYRACFGELPSETLRFG